MKSVTSIDEYIGGYPPNVRAMLRKVRAAIRLAAPKATEAIKYGMPAFVLDGKNMIFFGGFKNHIGLYATPRSHVKFAAALARYAGGKGSVQFPLDQPIPYSLITRIARFRASDMAKQAAEKKSKRRAIPRRR